MPWSSSGPATEAATSNGPSDNPKSHTIPVVEGGWKGGGRCAQRSVRHRMAPEGRSGRTKVEHALGGADGDGPLCAPAKLDVGRGKMSDPPVPCTSMLSAARASPRCPGRCSRTPQPSRGASSASGSATADDHLPPRAGRGYHAGVFDRIEVSDRGRVDARCGKLPAPPPRLDMASTARRRVLRRNPVGRNQVSGHGARHENFSLIPHIRRDLIYH